MNKIKLVGFLIFTACSASAAVAPQSGADFLNIGAGARAGGMGSAFTAVADDATSMYWNPAGLSLMFQPEANFSHSAWLLGTTYDFLGYAQPTPFGSLGLGVTRLSDGQIDGRASDRTQSGGFTAADTAYALGYGHSLGSASRFGMSVKYINSTIGADSASTFAADIGAMKALDSLPVAFGVAVQNIGPGLRFMNQTDPLPLAVSAGSALGIAGSMRVALNVKYQPNDHQTSVALGTEYTVLSALSIRAGYTTAFAQALKNSSMGSSPLAGLGGGFGLHLDRYSADYTITPFGDLGNIQQLSLGVKFGRMAKDALTDTQNKPASSAKNTVLREWLNPDRVGW